MNSPADKPYYIVPTCHERVGTLFRDEHILLVNKPAYLLSVPGRAPENQDCAVRRLARKDPDIRLVHRLDLDTSGIMVFALTRPAQSQLSRLFQQRTVKKRYQAVVHGLVERERGSIELPLIPDWPNRPLQKVCYDSGKAAQSEYRVVERVMEPFTTKVTFTPITGRTHQLRVHSRELGHPILGCDLYATDEAFFMADRLMLHATTIEFNHPVTGQRVNASCPCPF